MYLVEDVKMLPDEQNIKDIYNKLHELTEDLCVNEQYTPLEVASVLITHSIRMYKVMLDEDDFEAIMQTIWGSLDEIQPFDNRVLN